MGIIKVKKVKLLYILATKQDQWPERCSFTYKTLKTYSQIYASFQAKITKLKKKRIELANYPIVLFKDIHAFFWSTKCRHSLAMRFFLFLFLRKDSPMRWWLMTVTEERAKAKENLLLCSKYIESCRQSFKN